MAGKCHTGSGRYDGQTDDDHDDPGKLLDRRSFGQHHGIHRTAACHRDPPICAGYHAAHIVCFGIVMLVICIAVSVLSGLIVFRLTKSAAVVERIKVE